MMEEMSSLDIHYLLKELGGLQGGTIQKIYQRDRTFRFQIYAQGDSYDLIVSPGSMYLSRFDRKGPKKPTNFCMFLRKHLRNKKLREINQHRFDRVVELKTRDRTLICELFGKGNFVLVDGDGKIVQPLEIRKWSEREIKPKVRYKYPPSGRDPRETGKREFKRIVEKDREIVRLLARSLNLGGRWAEEVCARAGVDKNKVAKTLEDREIVGIYDSMQSLFGEDIDAKTVLENNKKTAAIPFPMKTFQGKESENYDSFNRALDVFFSEKEREKVEEEVKEKKEEKVSKYERMKKEQEEAIEKWEEIDEESKEAADLIYENYSLVEGVLEGLQKAIESDLSWSEVKDRIGDEDTPESRAIVEINEGDGTVVVEIEDKKIELDFRKSVEENAESFYEDSKWAKEKMEKAREKMAETEEEKKEIEKKSEEEFIEEDKERGKPEEKVEVKKESGWYKKYRWFKTSEGFLVIAGKNADQNEEIIKKHAEENNIVIHPDLPGSPFTVIKAEGKDIQPLAVREAAEFCASFSDAWKNNYGSIDVYWVKPDQITKEAPAGENIEKGSFMIEGEKNYLKKTELKISVGVQLNREENEIRLLNGSTQAVGVRSDYFVTLNPGDTEKNELARQIKNKLAEKASPEDKNYIRELPLEEIKVLLPPDGGLLVG